MLRWRNCHGTDAVRAILCFGVLYNLKSLGPHRPELGMRLRMHRKGKRTFASACYCPRTNLFCFTLLRPTPQQHSHMVTCRNLDTTDTLHTKALLAVPNHRIIRYPSGSAMNAPVPAKAKQTHFRASCAHVATTASPLHAQHRNSIGTCSVPES